MTAVYPQSLLHMKEKNTIFKGAFYLAVGAFISKFLGAIYRVPLTNMLGGFGLGLYQMVFPVYCLLLDFSGAGLPSALSRLIASQTEDKEKTAKRLLINSIKLFFILGIIGTLIMAIFSKPFSILQGNEKASAAYLFLSPAILAVSIISCLRGYFQGFMDMKPTAISQIVEQVIKLILGIVLVYLLMDNVSLAVGGATFAITISEFVSLFILWGVYKKRNKSNTKDYAYDKKSFFLDAKCIIKTTIPITLVGILIPFSQVIDSILTINFISGYRTDATALFGLLSGVVMTVINLPVSICYGIGSVAIPSISKCKTEEQKKNRAIKVLILTLIVSIPCFFGLLIFSPQVINLLFRNLPLSEKRVAVNLLRLTSPSVVLLSVLQASNSVFIGKGKLYTPVINLAIGVAIKFALSVMLLRVPSINIYGGAIAINACYFSVCVINLISIFNTKVKNASKIPYNRKFANQE